MYTDNICKSGCSKVQGANVFPSHCNILYITLYCDSCYILCFQLYIHALALMHAIHAVSCLVLCTLILTDCQSNALTPSICNMMTSLMDVMSYVAVSIKCYLFCSHLYSSVECAVYMHTVHSHCQVFYLHLTNACSVYVHAYKIIHSFFMCQSLLSLCFLLMYVLRITATE